MCIVASNMIKNVIKSSLNWFEQQISILLNHNCCQFASLSVCPLVGKAEMEC